jgi:hypothetical protein
MFFPYADANPVEMAPGLVRRTMVSGDTITIRQAMWFWEKSALP